MPYTDEQLRAMDLDAAKAEIANAVYEATRLYEYLETHGRRVRGNGHHMRQRIAKAATDLLEERWEGLR